MAEYTLYWGPKMGSAAVQAALIWADLPHQLVQVNFGNSEHKTAEYRAINPAGKIPALRLPDGTVLSESGAMMVYLSDLVPERGLLPGVTAAARAEALRWLFLFASEAYPAVLCAYHPENFVDGEAAKQSLLNQATATLDRLSGLFVQQALSKHKFALGDQLSMVDVYAAMLLSWHPALHDLCQRLPVIVGFYENVWADPPVHTAFTQHKLQQPPSL
jgi:glutathione S-transferase